CATLLMNVLVQSNQSANIALDKARKELQASVKNEGLEHIQTLTLRVHLGNLLWQNQRAEEAENEYQKVITSLKKQGNLNTLTGLEARGGLAEIQRGKGQPEQAEITHRTLFEEALTLLGEQHAFTLECKNRRAVTLCELGRCQEAMNLLHEVLSDRIKTLGEESEPVFATYYQMGVCMLELKQTLEAQNFATKALAGYQKIKGPHAAETEKVKNLIARVKLDSTPMFRLPASRAPSFQNQTLDPNALPDTNPFSIQAPMTLLPVDMNGPTSDSRYLR
ncbi:MAG: tetratricopeptide repeat protein, partial [Prosthecobacter sp.]|nr:tetratricopeptide repeat protein [Prosthecobacter sp.]